MRHFPAILVTAVHRLRSCGGSRCTVRRDLFAALRELSFTNDHLYAYETMEYPLARHALSKLTAVAFFDLVS